MHVPKMKVYILRMIKINYHVLLLLSSIGITTISMPILADEPIVLDLKTAFKQAENEESISLKIDFGNGLTLPAIVQLTSKGNGTLSLPNLSLRLLDVNGQQD